METKIFIFYYCFASIPKHYLGKLARTLFFHAFVFFGTIFSHSYEKTENKMKLRGHVDKENDIVRTSVIFFQRRKLINWRFMTSSITKDQRIFHANYGIFLWWVISWLFDIFFGVDFGLIRLTFPVIGMFFDLLIKSLALLCAPLQIFDFLHLAS